MGLRSAVEPFRSVLSSGTIGLVASLWIRSAKNDDWQDHVSEDAVFQPPFPSRQGVAAVNRDTNNNWAFQIGEKTGVKKTGITDTHRK